MPATPTLQKDGVLNFGFSFPTGILGTLWHVGGSQFFKVCRYLDLCISHVKALSSSGGLLRKIRSTFQLTYANVASPRPTSLGHDSGNWHGQRREPLGVNPTPI
ncbi:hypothetical protein E2C01_066519 [Portunus trituberculatus]|uniref:Uncharacterized protein n=1 Tax=Portunus trituberculatus TaxID=210409 RepID=A0A5B7HHB4_PORTR|nr:hypothetical protein [Portunus trituberculatus]